MGLFIILVVISGLVLIFSYINLGALRDEIRGAKKKLTVLKKENAGLENQIYALTDLTKLSELAVANGLIMEKHPAYVTLK